MPCYRGENLIYKLADWFSSLAEIRARLKILEKDNVIERREVNSVAALQTSKSGKALLTGDVIQIQPCLHAGAIQNLEMGNRLEAPRGHERRNSLRVAGNGEEHDPPIPSSDNESESHEISRYPQSDKLKVDHLNSSNMSFLENVAQAPRPTEYPAHLASDEFQNRADHVFGIASPQEDRLSLDVAAIALPERHVADDLLANFWENVHPIFPVLHRPSITGYYE